MDEVLRQEKKYLLTLDEYYRLSHRLGQVMRLDSHSSGDGYLIRSLYFDTLEDKDFEEKEDGVDIRRKIRLRNYGAGSAFALLEMKQKQSMLQKKRSLRMTREDAQKLIEGKYSVLLQYPSPFAAECYCLMNMLAYRPKAVISYHRKAFVAQENKTRITFDHHLTGSEGCFDIFSDSLLENAILDPFLVVLEVKFNGFLLGYLKDLLAVCSHSELSASKYCMGRAVSKHYTF